MRNLLIMIALMFLFLVWVTYKIDDIEAGLKGPGLVELGSMTNGVEK